MKTPFEWPNWPTDNVLQFAGKRKFFAEKEKPPKLGFEGCTPERPGTNLGRAATKHTDDHDDTRDDSRDADQNAANGGRVTRNGGEVHRSGIGDGRSRGEGGSTQSSDEQLFHVVFLVSVIKTVSVTRQIPSQGARSHLINFHSTNRGEREDYPDQ